jgi:hypothetical protein
VNDIRGSLEVDPIMINCEPGRRRKKMRPAPPTTRAHVERNGGNFLDPKKDGMRWGSIAGGW